MLYFLLSFLDLVLKVHAAFYVSLCHFVLHEWEALQEWGDNSSKVSCPNSFPSPSGSRESCKAMYLKHEIQSAKMFSIPLYVQK